MTSNPMLSMASRVLVIGGSGQLGQAFLRLLPPGVAISPGRFEFDLSRPSEVAKAMGAYTPDVVINCAAYTQVDRAETEPDACQLVNAESVAALANASAQCGAIFVQISTDYVFGGRRSPNKPWQETDQPCPQGVYARSKLAGEEAAALCPRHFVVRTCGLYGGGPRRVSFVEKMLQVAETRPTLRVVDDQRCTPSLVDDVAAAVLQLVEIDRFGTYHIVNHGQTTWYHFAKELFRLAQLGIDVEPITSAQFNAPAPRPEYSVLDTTKYQVACGSTLRHWSEALADYLANLRPLRLC